MLTTVFAHFSLGHLAYLFNFNLSNLIWPSLFPATFLLHLVEEYWCGGGYAANLSRTRGVSFSSWRFFALTSFGLFLMVLGLILAYQHNFPEMMLAILGTTVLLNGLSHAVTSLKTYSYNPGLISGVLIWMPLGAVTLLQLTGTMSGARYLTALGIGAGIQVFALLITLSGGQPIKARHKLLALKKSSATKTGDES